MGTNPRAPLRAISSAESDQSRLEVSTTAGAVVAAGDPRRDLEAVEVGELDVEQDDVRVAGGAASASARRPSAASPTTS